MDSTVRSNTSPSNPSRTEPSSSSESRSRPGETCCLVHLPRATASPTETSRTSSRPSSRRPSCSRRRATRFDAADESLPSWSSKMRRCRAQAPSPFVPSSRRRRCFSCSSTARSSRRNDGGVAEVAQRRSRRSSDRRSARRARPARCRSRLLYDVAAGRRGLRAPKRVGDSCSSTATNAASRLVGVSCLAGDVAEALGDHGGHSCARPSRACGCRPRAAGSRRATPAPRRSRRSQTNEIRPTRRSASVTSCSSAKPIAARTLS